MKYRSSCSRTPNVRPMVSQYDASGACASAAIGGIFQRGRRRGRLTRLSRCETRGRRFNQIDATDPPLRRRYLVEPDLTRLLPHNALVPHPRVLSRWARLPSAVCGDLWTCGTRQFREKLRPKSRGPESGPHVMRTVLAARFVLSGVSHRWRGFMASRDGPAIPRGVRAATTTWSSECPPRPSCS